MISAFVGLGNPGDKYNNTRHNAGFWLVDKLADYFNVSWKEHRKFNGLYSDFMYNGRKVFLLKPRQYMNLSGQSVAQLAKFYNLSADDFCIVHDELDLPTGQIRLKHQGGCSGHNGLKSIKSHLHSLDFYRLRLGIDRPKDSGLVSDYVLSNPSISDMKLINSAIDRGVDAIDLILNQDIEAAMKLLNSVK